MNIFGGMKVFLIFFQGHKKWTSFRGHFSVLLSFLFSFFLRLLARSNFDHYARECKFGILKKKKTRKIFWLCF